MLATKLRVAFFLFALIFSNEFANNVNGVPTRRPSLNPNTTRIRSTPPPKKPPQQARSGRFLGKFSILAGLGLPEPTPMPISRNDYLYEQRGPAHFAASYNFPPTRWGPYVAAVYEPIPLASFMQNPLGYLASVLNPFSWFVGPENASVTPAAPPERHREDVVVVVREPENELISDERRTTVAAMDATEERERETLPDEKIHDDEKVTTSKSIRKMKLRPTIDIEKIMDLIAEETTMKLVRSDDNLDDESRQAHKPSTTTKASTMTTRHTQHTQHTQHTHHTQHTQHTQHTLHTTKATAKTTPMKHTPTKPSTTSSTTVEEVTDEAGEEATTIQNSTTNATTAAPYPHPSYGPPNYVDGYYHGGYPQNVSHIELTTQAGAASFGHAAPIAFHSFNDVNPIPQQLPNNYYDTFDPQAQAALDYYSHFDRLQPVDNHYQQNERTYSGSNRNAFGPNGFRPSYPVYQ